ncbi:MAG: hypothetical protein IKA01_10585 [Alistipes sp.]|nr:hypothetical protein [Alistipes sp.]
MKKRRSEGKDEKMGMAGDYLNVGDCHVAMLLAMTENKEVRDSNPRLKARWSDVGENEKSR